jgi:FtsP/CotA-like multicopper oxidase with cupredoxin domain
MQDMSINLKLAPHTPMFAADLGERVEFVVIGHGNTHHTFHLHGHRWAMTRTGTLATPDREVPVVDNRTVGPADSFGFQVIAGEGVGPGVWMYHCHVQFPPTVACRGCSSSATSTAKSRRPLALRCSGGARCAQ